ncbi:MAG: 4Fe-4S binding protein [candidate division Zixibacteria bacterium]|nr:4Fe-4S binding protein [candidate division Zixibacteria bacterium]
MVGLRYIPDVTTLKLDIEKCTGCTMCTIVCPHAVFAIEEKRSKIDDADACMECGACARNCPEGALTVDAGVGCAYAIMIGSLRGTEPTCDCAKDASCC